MNKSIAAFTLAAALTGCISDDLETSTTESDISVYGWLDDLKVPNDASSYQVGLAQLGTQLHMMYTDSGSHLVKHGRFDGSTWSATSTNLQADYGPALANYKGLLYTIYHSAGQNRLLMSTSTNGTTWSAPVAAGAPLASGTTVTYAPAAGVMNNTLFIAYCIHDSNGDHIRVDQKLSASWTTKQVYDVSGTCKSIALGPTASGGGLRLVYNEDYDGTWFMNDVSLTGDAGGGLRPELLTFRSKKPASVTTCNGTMHMVHGGNSTPDDIWWTYLRSDDTWAPDQRVPSQASNGGAQLVCYNNRLLMVHNGGYDQLWWSEYVPD